VITTLDSLDKDALMEILLKPKNALTKQFKKLFLMENVDLEFRDDALNAIAEKALERKSGARGLRSIIEVALKQIMFDIPSVSNLEKVVIDKNVILKKQEPYMIFSESKKEQSKQN
jgi:ATP-dependent Clp protease ATP-binding subunit ClpX